MGGTKLCIWWNDSAKTRCELATNGSELDGGEALCPVIGDADGMRCLKRLEKKVIQ